MPLRSSARHRADPERAALVELEDRILERALERASASAVSRRGAPALRDPAATCSTASPSSAC